MTMRNRVVAKEGDGHQGQKAYGRNKAEKRVWLHIDMHGISQVAHSLRFLQLFSLQP